MDWTSIVFLHEVASWTSEVAAKWLALVKGILPNSDLPNPQLPNQRLKLSARGGRLSAFR
jgi:hypothetical protein